MANPNSGYLSRDGSMQQNTPYFPTNNAFAGYDANLSDSHDLQTNNEHWAYDHAPLHVGHEHDTSPSLYQGWHPTGEQHNLAYLNGTLPFQNNAFVGSNNFEHPSHANFDAAYISRANDGASAYNNVNSTFPSSSVSSGTIAPGALQQRPQINRNVSNTSQQQQVSTTPKYSDLPNDEVVKAAQEPPKPLPRGIAFGNFMIISPESLQTVGRAKRLHNFVDVGIEPIDVWSTKTTIPSYIARKSRNEISKILANSTGGVTSKVSKKPPRNTSALVRKLSSDRSSTIAVVRREVKGAAPETPSEENFSDDDSDSDASDEESMQAPLPAVRPSKAIDAVQYDTVKTLWRVPYRSATADDIRKGLADFWDIVRTIRDRWKSDAQAVKAAEEAKKVGELPLLNERVANQREMLEAALNAAISQGHRDIVEHLAENVQLVLALAQFLRDRAASGDYSGALSKAILELLSRCKTLTDGVLEKTTISKVLPRFSKRGDDSIKSLAKRISDNGTAAARKKKEVAKATSIPALQPKEANKAGPSSAPTAVSSSAGVKRARPNESTNGPPTKRPAVEPLVSNTGATGPQVKPSAAVKRVPSNSENKPQAAAAVSAVPKKVTPVAVKPSSFFTNAFAGLQSAKKPSVVTTTKPAAQPKATSLNAKAVTTPTPAKPAAAAPRPLFSIADTLASVSRPREVEPVPKREQSAPPETAEERVKRLRKEQRRKLRVSFRSDDSLVSYRLLTPPLEDEQGPREYEVRDAGDIDSEGRMFKLHHDDKMDIEEDDDAALNPVDDLTRLFSPPGLIDFSTLPEEERERLYAPYGGGVLKPESPEAEIQERREANTLIAVYARASDIPATPKEPPATAEEPVTLKDFGTLPDIVLRLEALENAPKPPVSLPVLPPDIVALLKSLPQQPQQQPEPESEPQQPAQPSKTLMDLEKLFSQFSQTGASSQTTQPVRVPTPPDLFPNMSMQQQPAPFANLAGLFNAQPQPQQVQGFQQPAPALEIPENLSSILESLKQSAPLAGMMGSGANNHAQYGQQPQQNYANYSAPTSTYAAPQQQAQPQYSFEHPERRKWIESGGADTFNNSNNDQGGESKQKKNSGGWKGHGNRGPPQFVEICKYWKSGKCRKGANCTYLHTD